MTGADDKHDESMPTDEEFRLARICAESDVRCRIWTHAQQEAVHKVLLWALRSCAVPSTAAAGETPLTNAMRVPSEIMLLIKNGDKFMAPKVIATITMLYEHSQMMERRMHEAQRDLAEAKRMHAEAIAEWAKWEGEAKRLSATEPKVCEWEPDDDGVYWTTCGNGFTFIDAGPKENSMNFCCYCAGKLVPVDGSADA